MTGYTAPLDDIRFALSTFAGLDDIATLPGFSQATPDLTAAVLEEAAKLAGEVLAPLNVIGDRQPSTLENGVVRTPPGFAEAYRQYAEGGWNGLPFPEEIGGQGLPLALSTAVLEMWNSANLSFALCPLLNLGAVELLEAHGSPEQKATYIPNMVSGAWAGTMNLTEPQAGSDLGAIRTRAVRDGDRYRITGQKIFITYGEHDFTPNIIHLVLARLNDAPAGSKGLSLFIVPKYLVNPDGSLGERNDLRCVSLEHKLGIHASPTCVMSYGDNGGAVGFLVGQENRGIECMFTMMNSARLNVGVEGVAIAERAYQQARDYARDRIQGRPAAGGASILYHPDVRRMLLHMRSLTEAARALTYFVAGTLDRARRHERAEERQRHQRLADLLIPMVKAWSTDAAVEVASLGVQVHGGMGFIEETGAAQHYRDARIMPIYEGTNGIQALDLLGRKLLRDEGAAARELLAEMRESLAAFQSGNEDIRAMAAQLSPGVTAIEDTVAWLLEEAKADLPRTQAGATSFLKLFGTVFCGWLLARGASATGDRPRILTARFFAEQVLPPAIALGPAIRGGATVMGFDPDRF